MIRSPSIERANGVSDSKSRRFLDRYLGTRVPGNPSRDDVLAALREHVYLTVMLGYECDDGTMTDLYKGVLVEASRDPATREKADQFALVTRPAANVWHLRPDVLAQVIAAHEHAAGGEREAAEPLTLLPEVAADGIEEYAGDDLRGGYRWPVGSALTAVVIYSPPWPGDRDRGHCPASRPAAPHQLRQGLARNAARPRASWLAMKAAGTVTRISSACGRQNQALSPRESASFTSACSGQRPLSRLPAWQGCGAPPRAATSAAASYKMSNRMTLPPRPRRRMPSAPAGLAARYCRPGQAP